MSNHLSVFSCLVGCDSGNGYSSLPAAESVVQESFDSVIRRVKHQIAGEPGTGNGITPRDSFEVPSFSMEEGPRVVVRTGVPYPLEHRTHDVDAATIDTGLASQEYELPPSGIVPLQVAAGGVASNATLVGVGIEQSTAPGESRDDRERTFRVSADPLTAVTSQDAGESPYFVPASNTSLGEAEPEGLSSRVARPDSPSETLTEKSGRRGDAERSSASSVVMPDATGVVNRFDAHPNDRAVVTTQGESQLNDGRKETVPGNGAGRIDVSVGETVAPQRRDPSGDRAAVAVDDQVSESAKNQPASTGSTSIVDEWDRTAEQDSAKSSPERQVAPQANDSIVSKASEANKESQDRNLGEDTTRNALENSPITAFESGAFVANESAAGRPSEANVSGDNSSASNPAAIWQNEFDLNVGQVETQPAETAASDIDVDFQRPVTLPGTEAAAAASAAPVTAQAAQSTPLGRRVTTSLQDSAPSPLSDISVSQHAPSDVDVNVDEPIAANGDALLQIESDEPSSTNATEYRPFADRDASPVPAGDVGVQAWEPVTGSDNGIRIDAAHAEFSAEITAEAGEVAAEGSVLETALEEVMRDASRPEAIKKTSETVRDAVASSLRLEGKTVQVELHPAELGALKIQVTQHEDSIEAQIIASESMTSELLIAHREQLLETLADLGYDNAEVNISNEDDARPDFGREQDRSDIPYPSKPKARPSQQNTAASGGVNIVA